MSQSKAALLVMDFQIDIVAMLADGGSHAAVARARAAIEGARKKRMPVIFVRVAYRDHHADASARNKRVSMLKEKGMLLEANEGSGFVKEIAPQPGDAIVTKRRVSALAHTDLLPLLNACEIDTLVMAGLATSGVVLSTVRQAADADYRMVVLEDACADGDSEVHRLLVSKVFPSQCEVMKVDQFLTSFA